MTIKLEGNWKKGFAHDVHTLDSVYLGVDEHGHDRWENTRSEMGELLYRLKYQGDVSTVGPIVDMLGKYKGIDTIKNILLLDDLYRSGATLSVATELLYERAHARDVYVLAMTKTRSAR